MCSSFPWKLFFFFLIPPPGTSFLCVKQELEPVGKSVCIKVQTAQGYKNMGHFRMCVSSLCLGHADGLCVVLILVYVLPNQALSCNTLFSSSFAQSNPIHPSDLSSRLSFLRKSFLTASSLSSSHYRHS